MKNKRSLYAFVLVLAIIAAAFLVYKNVYAASGQSFGGRVVGKISCTCDKGTQLITVSGQAKSSGTYLYIPGTGVSTKVGTKILGTYKSGGTCSVVSGNSCTKINATRGTITKFGSN